MKGFDIIFDIPDEEDIFKLKTLGDAINVNIRRSEKAKHIGIRIKGRNYVELVLPLPAPRERGIEFLIQKESWIRSKLKSLPKIEVDKTPKQSLPEEINFLGQLLDVIYMPTKNEADVLMQRNTITVASPETLAHKTLIEFLKKQASEKLHYLVPTLVKKHQLRNHGQIKVKELKSRWGSCSSTGDLTFNWRIVLAPFKVFRYVVVHEICHLEEMNHSPVFWKLVENICPEYKEHKLWLKEHGNTLYECLPKY